MLGIPLRIHDRADHGFDAPVILGAATHLEAFGIGQACQDESIGCPRVASYSAGRKSVRLAIARMIPHTKSVCASSMGRREYHLFDVQRIEIGFHARSPQNFRNLAGRDDDLREPGFESCVFFERGLGERAD